MDIQYIEYSKILIYTAYDTPIVNNDALYTSYHIYIYIYMI